MGLLASTRYLIQVQVLGRTVLHLRRRRAEARSQASRPPFGPALRSSAWLKELISTHYLQGQFSNGHKPVAWVTSGGPVEFLKALGYHTYYPENHGAICGVRRQAELLCQIAEEIGFSRELCSYARTDIGSVASGQTPVGRVPRPDLLLCCTNICQTVLYWYQVLADRFKIPLVLIDTPFVYSQASPASLAFVERQLSAAIEVAERVAKRSLDHQRFTTTVTSSREACELWAAIMALGKHRPAPLSAFDQFFFMAPVVDMRGEAVTVAFYRRLLAELEARAAAGIGAISQERRRLVWDNLPIWPRVKQLSGLLAEAGVALVASTYTNAWGELASRIDPSKPLKSMADVYLHPLLNRGVGDKLKVIEGLVREYQADGVILHSDRSCKPYSIGQQDQAERLGRAGIPALLLEADHNDPRSYAQEQIANRLEVFWEVLG